MLNQIAIVTTLRCDLKCQHCLRGFPKERPDFPMDLLDKLLTEAMPFGVKHVGLTGGEPHLHPQFETMVEKIVAYGYSWHFVSHGQRTEPYFPLMERFRDKFKSVSISLDGATAKTHDEIRQRKGAFDKAVASIKKYVQAGFKIMIAMTLNQKNKSEADAMLELAKDLGVDRVGFGGTIPTTWNQNLLLTDGESLELYKRISALCQGTGIEIDTVSSLYTRGGLNFCRILNLQELTFNSLGELIFCCDTIENGAAIGSLHEHSFAELVKLWLTQSANVQIQRTEQIARGNMGNGFDTCAFCNAYYSTQ
jgi:MoaA/NifB/PqqE/SkfB family radical SAM enzyme